MAILRFDIPVDLKYIRSPSFSLLALEFIDHYFYLRGEKGYFLPQQFQINGQMYTVPLGREWVFLGGGEILPTPSSCLPAVIKIVSYITLVIPLIMYLAKVFLHSYHHFEVVSLGSSSPETRRRSGKHITASGDIMDRLL